MSLQDYIDAEDRALKQSLLQYPEHYRLFGELDDLYDALIHGRVLTENDIVLPLVFVLVVQRHLLGVATQLLRRRVTDAACLTRRAIEVTAAGHYLWIHPESKEVTSNALFTEQTAPWSALRALYDRFGALPAPAGPGVSVKYEILHGALKFNFIEPDDQIVREAWETQLNTYGELLEVAITILAATIEDSKVALLRIALARWKEAVRGLVRKDTHTTTDSSGTGVATSGDNSKEG